MSKGAQPATQTQKVEIPDEFKAWVFGPGMYGGTQGGGSSSGFISQDIHKLHTGSGSKFDPLNLVKKKNPGTAAQYMDAGFEGILPMALGLAQDGNLVPTRTMSEGTKMSQGSLLELVDALNTSLIPQAQDSIYGLANSDLVNSQVTQDVIDSSTRPVMEQLARYAIPSTQDSAIAAGQLGSSRQGIAEGLARSDANQQMSDIAAQIAFGAMQEDQTNKRFGAQMLPTLQSLMTTPTTLLSELGSQQEDYDMSARSSQAQNLQALAALLQGFIPGTNSTQTQTAAKTGNEKLGGAISGASAGSTAGPWGAAIGAILGAMAG